MRGKERLCRDRARVAAIVMVSVGEEVVLWRCCKLTFFNVIMLMFTARRSKKEVVAKM